MSRAKKMSVKDLNFQNTGSWPQEYKLAFCGIVVLLIVGLAYWFFARDKTDELEQLERQETDLRAEFETKQGRAANLEPLKLQLTQMEQQREATEACTGRGHVHQRAPCPVLAAAPGSSSSR